jgi:hypothetical protein
MNQVVNDVKIDPSWKEALKEEFASNYFAELKQFLVEERQVRCIARGNRPSLLFQPKECGRHSTGHSTSDGRRQD